jgi:uncharacterized protein
VKQAVQTFNRIAWSNPKLERQTTPASGDGLFALEPVAKGELLVVWGGIIITTEQLYQAPEFARHRSIQVDDNLHLCSGLIDDDADCINHSCDPNAGISGQISLVAIRDIEVGEEICFDYCMSDSLDTFSMACYCGHPHCRGAVHGTDWKDPELQERYKGYFSAYIQRKIDASRR